MAEITDVFKYLKEYNNIRNPVITNIEKQEWSYNLKNLPEITELWSIYNIQDFDELKVLEIERPHLLPCPFPNKEIQEWIDSNWNKLSVQVIEYIQNKKRTIINENGETIEEIENFSDDKSRVEKYDNWIIQRQKWYETEKPKEDGLKFYNQLFSLYSRLNREAESLELVLGDGLIKWAIDERIINHPVLLQKVDLEFNSNKPSFIITCDEIKTEIYTPMLRVINSVDQTIISEIIKEIEEKNDHIADINNNVESYRRLINGISESGGYLEHNSVISSQPSITSNPILFLRKRNLGFTEFINRIILDIESKEELILPRFFNNLLGHHKDETQSIIIEDNWNQSGIDEDVLLTLPANNEQMKIIKYLDNYGAVLVQGPPGTGKTHTIANLIGHLLSRGDSVLVTSHTEKALTVLKDKVYKDLRSLCISLLSSTSERKEMDATLFEIAEKGTTLDENVAINKIKKLENERKDLINMYKDKNKELLRIRSLEYNDLIYGNTTIKPIEAARFINEGIGKYDIIPGETVDNTILLPMKIEDLEYLYKSNDLINKDEEIILSKDLPDLENILTSERFQENISLIKEYKGQIKDWVEEFDFIEQISKEDIAILSENSSDIFSDITNMGKYERSIINKSIADKIYSEFWDEIFNEFDELKIEYEEYRKILFYNDYSIPEDIINKETVKILDEIIDTNKSMPINLLVGITKPKWKKLKDKISNNKVAITKLEEFKDAKKIIGYIIKKEEIVNRINKLNIDLEINNKLDCDEPEDNISSLLITVECSLEWYEKNWISFINELNKYIRNLKIDIQAGNSLDSILGLCNKYFSENLKNHYILMLLKECEYSINNFIYFLNHYKKLGDPFRKMLEVVEDNNDKEYNILYKEIFEIYSKKEIYNKRLEILVNLGNYAKDWANAIKNREEIHGMRELPKDIHMAWKWRQLSNQLNKIDEYNPNMIQKEIGKINNMLMTNAKELAYEKAWYNKNKNTTDEQTQAIEGWRQTIRLIGKGKGKQAPMLREKARGLMPKCQTAIPVWIMPLNRVAENFSPETNKFDVIIIDEASQADILALSALYLGKKIIVVGDDEQVSPESVGIKVDEISALAEQHLQEIPNNHLYGGKTSIYDIAKTSGFKPIMLVEHFRCLPEIIEFSNRLSYNGKIKPLRAVMDTSLKPSVVEYRVANGMRNEKKVNYEEVEHISSLICACIEDEAYSNKTIGVISLLGQDQAYEIDKSLQIRLDPKEYESRKIQCGRPAQFQGDERDIIFLSIVDSPKEGGGPLRLVSEDGNNDIYRKRYNVAASRAKDQMWVVHSLNPEIDLQPDDIRLRLIKFAMDPNANKDDELLRNTESDFEKKVMKKLLNKGYKVYPQWKVGAYRIDLVVEDNNKVIAVECDGEKWHTQDDLPNDLKRQAILERLGWKFIRIRGSEFYRDPEATMNRVYIELENNGINPNFISEGQNDVVNQNSRNELLDRIKIRAESFRRDWNVNDNNTIKNDLKEDNGKDIIEPKTINIDVNTESVKIEKNNKKNEKEPFQLEIKLAETGNKTSKIEGTIKIEEKISKPLFDFRKDTKESFTTGRDKLK